LSLDGAVDRRAADAEELGDLESAVLAAVYQGDQVCFLASVELGLLAAKPAVGTFMLLRVRSRIRSDSTMWTVPQR
jgi:hypothetical protein